MNYETIEVRTEGRVGVLTFIRLPVLNAFDPTLVRDTNDALGRFGEDDTVLSVVVNGQAAPSPRASI